jgi:hypothetical protein
MARGRGAAGLGMGPGASSCVVRTGLTGIAGRAASAAGPRGNARQKGGCGQRGAREGRKNAYYLKALLENT